MMRVLYIEDEPNDIHLVELYMQSISQSMVAVTNLQDAYKALDDRPDLILVDILLDQARSGYDFARSLRRQGYQTPLVAITALSTQKDIDACYEAGFDQVLVKPFMISQLAETIAYFIR
jgi:CheY-like chemotaxis protein